MQIKLTSSCRSSIDLFICFCFHTQRYNTSSSKRYQNQFRSYSLSLNKRFSYFDLVMITGLPALQFKLSYFLINVLLKLPFCLEVFILDSSWIEVYIYFFLANFSACSALEMSPLIKRTLMS